MAENENNPLSEDETQAGQELQHSEDEIRAESRRKAGSRDIPVSTILHLMGIPTQNDVSMLESKVDMLASKITALTLKVERAASQLQAITNEFYLDRIDFQLADIRTMMKKMFPALAVSPDGLAKEALERKAAAKEAKKTEKGQGSKEENV